VHLGATEHRDHVVFLHNIQEGPASRSYGLQVAKLAGIPAGVLRAAREKLVELERGAQDPAHDASPPAQSDLFSATASHPALDRLAALQLDEITPRQALEQLYELRALLNTTGYDSPD